MSVADWDNEYARMARAGSQIRSGLGGDRSGDLRSLYAGLDRLDGQLSGLPLAPTEVDRRRRLIQNLKQTTGSSTAPATQAGGGLQPAVGGAGAGGPQSQMATAMRQQDDMLDELAVGVGRLKTQTVAINDEARMHVNLLENMDNNLDHAQAGLEDQTRRAARLKEDQSVWRLQLIAAGLSILLVLLILMGLSP